MASCFNASEGISEVCAEWSLWVNSSAFLLGINSELKFPRRAPKQENQCDLTSFLQLWGP